MKLWTRLHAGGKVEWMVPSNTTIWLNLLGTGRPRMRGQRCTLLIFSILVDQRRQNFGEICMIIWRLLSVYQLKLISAILDGHFYFLRYKIACQCLEGIMSAACRTHAPSKLRLAMTRMVIWPQMSVPSCRGNRGQLQKIRDIFVTPLARRIRELLNWQKIFWVQLCH